MNFMWNSRQSKYLQPSAYSRRSTSFIDRDFQLKYTHYILIMAALSSSVFLFPALYLTNQNYNIFFDLADILSPSMAQYIDKERLTLNIAFAVLFLCNLIFWFVFSKKMTAKIAGPVKILRNHIRLFGRGDFSLQPLKIREDDEFRELVNTYNYLFILLQVQNKQELEELKKVRAAITNPVALDLISQMITEREQRLNRGQFNPAYDINPSFSAEPAATRDSRHAS